MSLVTETYWKAAQGVTPQGEPWAVVSRDQDGRITTWNLVKRGTGKGPRWFSTSPQQISTGKVRSFPEKKGVRLTDSRTDKILERLAEAA